MAEEKKSEPYVPATVGVVLSEIIGIMVLVLIIGSILGALTGMFNFNGKGLDGVSIPWYERFTQKGRLIAHSKPLSALENPIGMRVVSAKDNDVYDSPGGKKIGSHKLGDAGRVLQGPVEVGGVKYWYVDYDTDPDGWVKEEDVRSLTSPISSVEDPVGKSVMNTTDSDVIGEYGAVIGRHKAGDKGKITKGPKYIDGEKYWYVDYEEGPDGWVKESDLGLTEDETLLEKFFTKLFGISNILLYISFGIALLALGAIGYLWFKIDSIYKNEKTLLYPETLVSEEEEINPKWEKILSLIDSSNENDWRLAIIEADIMLAELLEKMQLPGETMGEKLKLIEKSDFTTLDSAWEAHKMRNAIAHQGSNFLLTQREARRIISLYQSVFDEFQMI